MQLVGTGRVVAERVETCFRSIVCCAVRGRGGATGGGEGGRLAAHDRVPAVLQLASGRALSELNRTGNPAPAQRQPLLRVVERAADNNNGNQAGEYSRSAGPRACENFMPRTTDTVSREEKAYKLTAKLFLTPCSQQPACSPCGDCSMAPRLFRMG